MKKNVPAAALRASLFATLVVCGISSVATAQSLPSPWTAQDVGTPALKGSTSHVSGTFTVKAAGADIWDADDEFHFVYQPVTGDVEVVVRVASMTKTHVWSKGGVMIREALTAESRNAMALVTVSKGYAFQRRPLAGAYTENTPGGNGAAPGWLKLVRRGDLFEAYRSSNGIAWTQMGSDTIPMGDTVYVGLAVTSRMASKVVTTVFDNVKVTAAPTTNKMPAISIMNPVTGSSVTAGSTMTIDATATDPENRMASVDFYANTTLIAKDTTAPYSTTWSTLATGTHALTAVAHDADGGSTTSAPVNVTVENSTNHAPIVSLSTGVTAFTAPATIALTATATDPEGQLARVEFFNGTTRLGTDTAAPYTFTWTGVAAGTYALTAVAYDAAGASGTSAPLTVTVSAPITTAPTAVAFTASSDHATNVTNYVLKIFAAGADVSAAAPLTTSDLGKPPVASNGEITVDRATFFSALAAGNYLATVTAIGPGGQTQSASISFTR